MQYTADQISKQTLLEELSKKYDSSDWNSLLEQASYSLIANCDNYKDYPQYYDFENINGKHYVVELRNNELAHIYQIHESSDYEYSCQEIFWETAHEWTNDIENVAHSIYLLD